MQSRNSPPPIIPEVRKYEKAILHPSNIIIYKLFGAAHFCVIKTLQKQNFYLTQQIIKLKGFVRLTVSMFLSWIPLILTPCLILTYILYTRTRNRI